MMKLILKSELNTNEIIRQMGNKQLDKFAFMVVLLFSLLACRTGMLHMRCGFDNVVLGIYFLGFL